MHMASIPVCMMDFGLLLDCFLARNPNLAMDFDGIQLKNKTNCYFSPIRYLRITGQTVQGSENNETNHTRLKYTGGQKLEKVSSFY